MGIEHWTIWIRASLLATTVVSQKHYDMVSQV
jgi:hypothetical protein